MSWHKRLLNVLRSNRLSRDIEREMNFHVGERADELMAAGWSRAEAQREAKRRFGNLGLQRERTREADLYSWLESFFGDVRYATRALRASPVFALVAILSLGLGIGANTAIFSLINAVMLKSLPVAHPEELVQVTMGADRGSSFTNPIWEQLRDRQDVFSGVAAFGGSGDFDLGSGGEVRRAHGSWVSGAFFTTLGVQPVLGRLIQNTDDVRGCAGVAVLGYAFWQSEFGGDRNVIGRTISLTTHPFQIIGVADPRFFGVTVGRNVQVYVPICSEAIIRGEGSSLDRRSHWWLNVIGRPKPGATADQVRSALRGISAATFDATVPPNWGVAEQKNYRARTFDVEPGGTGMSGLRREYTGALYALMAVVAVVLIVACANVANLLLARATARQREIAIRLAIGAGRGRLVRQLLTESVLLSALGAIMGVFFAQWGSRLLVGFLSTAQDPVSLDLSVDTTVLAFTVIVATTTGVLFGLAPAWRSARVNPQAVMKAGGRGVAEGHTRFSAGKVLVTAQIALSLVLVVASGLLLGSFRRLVTLDPGFESAGVLVVTVDGRNAAVPKDQWRAVYDQMLARARAMPGVRAASVADITPISGNAWNDIIHVTGFTPKSEDDALSYFNEVGDGYFATLGTSLVAGRDFDARDTPVAAKVAIVNEAFAKKFFAGVTPIGKQFRIKQGDALQPPVNIIGIVQDAKYSQLREATLPTAYYASSQTAKPGSFVNFALRGDASPTALIPGFTAIARDADPRMTLRFVPLEQQVAASLTRERLLATLSGFFGGLALLLATIGLYGIMSYNVARRRNEIGIRIALGAARTRVMRMVLGEVGRMVAIGIILGGIVAVASLRLMSALLFGLSPNDPVTLLASGAVLAIVAVAAGLLPAWRASRLDPMAALREE